MKLLLIFDIMTHQHIVNKRYKLLEAVTFLHNKLNMVVLFVSMESTSANILPLINVARQTNLKVQLPQAFKTKNCCQSPTNHTKAHL